MLGEHIVPQSEVIRAIMLGGSLYFLAGGRHAVLVPRELRVLDGEQDHVPANRDARLSAGTGWVWPRAERRRRWWL